MNNGVRLVLVSFPYDIAVMKTNTPIDASRVIKMATAEDEKNFIGEKCAISGWGLLGNYKQL